MPYTPIDGLIPQYNTLQIFTDAPDSPEVLKHAAEAQRIGLRVVIRPATAAGVAAERAAVLGAESGEQLREAREVVLGAKARRARPNHAWNASTVRTDLALIAMSDLIERQASVIKDQAALINARTPSDDA